MVLISLDEDNAGLGILAPTPSIEDKSVISSPNVIKRKTKYRFWYNIIIYHQSKTKISVFAPMPKRKQKYRPW